MNILLFGKPGTLLSTVAKALRPLRPRSVRVADNWGSLQRGLLDRKLNLAILHLDPFVIDDPEAANNASELVELASIPTIVVSDDPTAAMVVAVYFENVLEAPFGATELQALVQGAGRNSDDQETVQTPLTSTSSIERLAQPRPKPKMPARKPRPVQPTESPVQQRSLSDERTTTAKRPIPRMVDLPDSPHTSSAERREERTGPTGFSTVRSVALPPLTRGDLRKHLPIRVMWAHHLAESTGILSLAHKGVTRQIAFVNGRPGVLGARVIEPARRNKICSALVWRRGSYEFNKRQDFRKERFCPFGHVLELIHGTIEMLSFNLVAERLNTRLRTYPIVTDRFPPVGSILSDLSGVTDFVQRCGGSTLEQLATSAGSSLQPMLRAALFCCLVDVVLFEPQAIGGRVTVRYPDLNLQAKKPPKPKRSKRRSTPTQKRAAPSVAMTFEQLQAVDRHFESVSSYELFSLEPGCGKEPIHERFLDLVRTHHPDRHARERDPEVKRIAERIFRRIKRAYTEISKLEGGSGKNPFRRTKSTGDLSGLSNLSGLSGLGASSVDTDPRQQTKGYATSQSEVSSGTYRVTRPKSNKWNRPESSSEFSRSETSSPGRSDGNTSGFSGSGAAWVRRPDNEPTYGGSASNDAHSQPTPASGPPSNPAASEASAPPVAGNRSASRTTVNPGSGSTTRSRNVNATGPPSSSDNPSISSSRRSSNPQQRPPPPVRPPSGPKPSKPQRASKRKRSPFRVSVLEASAEHMGVGESTEQDDSYTAEELDQLYLAGKLLLKKGSADRAIEAFQELTRLEAENNDFAAHLVWARYLVDNSETGKIKKELLRLDRLKSSEFPALFLGMIASAEGHDDIAYKFFRRCLTINPKNREAEQRVRLIRMRTERNKGKDQGRLFDRLFSKRTKAKDKKGR